MSSSCLAVYCRRPLPRPEGAQLDNELDKLMRITRSTEIMGILDDLERVKEKDPGVEEILTELDTVCQTLRAQAVEVPQAI